MKHCFGGSELFVDFRFSLSVSESNARTKRGMTTNKSNVEILFSPILPESRKNISLKLFQISPAFPSDTNSIKRKMYMEFSLI